MHRGRLDEDCYVDGKLIGPAAKTELQLWLERLRIPEVRAVEYTRRFESEGFDDLQAVIEDARPNDLMNIGMLDGHLRRVEKDLEKLRLDWFKDAPIDERTLTVVIFRGRDVPSSLTPAQLAETVLYSVIPPAPGEAQLTEVPRDDGDMAVLQVPLSSAYYRPSSAEGEEGGGYSPTIIKSALPSPPVSAHSPGTARVDVGESITGGDRRDHVGLNPNVREWCVEDVVTWICQFEPLRSKAYVAEIRRQRVNGERLLSIISFPQIEMLGIKLRPHKRKLLQEINTLRTQFIASLKGQASGTQLAKTRKAGQVPGSARPSLEGPSDTTSPIGAAASSGTRRKSDPLVKQRQSRGQEGQDGQLKDDDAPLAPTPVGSLSPTSPGMLDGTHAYANRQMLQRLRPETGEEMRRRMEEKETPRWGQRAPSKSGDGRATAQGGGGGHEGQAVLGFADDLDAYKPEGSGGGGAGGGLELNSTYEWKKGVLKASGFQIEPSGITHVPDDPAGSARTSYDEGPSQRPSDDSATTTLQARETATALAGLVDPTLTALINTPRNVRDNLVTLDEVGSGACASVYRAVYLPTLTVVAVKYFPIHDQARRRQLVQELRSFLPLNWVLLSESTRLSSTTAPGSSADDSPFGSPSHQGPKCPHVISFYDAYTDTYSDSVSMVLEYMNGGTLQDLTKRTGGIKDETIIAWISFQICKGLQEIHSRAQIHRDIKPSNILLNSHGDVKISDFGIARILEDSLALAMTFNGTTMYMAPERLNGDAYSYSSDVWSFGLSIITLATGHTPVPTNEGFWGILRSVKARPPSLSPTNFSPELCDFVSKCCAVDPKERSTAEALLRHDFLVKNAPTSVPPAFEQLLPLRPVDMNAIPGPKRKIIKSFIREAVSAKLSKLHDISEEEAPILSGASMSAYFRDRDLQSLEEQLRLPLGSVPALFRAEVDKQLKKRGLRTGSASRRSRVSTISSSVGSATPDMFRSREPSRSPAMTAPRDGIILEEVARRLAMPGLDFLTPPQVTTPQRLPTADPSGPPAQLRLLAPPAPPTGQDAAASSSIALPQTAERPSPTPTPPLPSSSSPPPLTPPLKKGIVPPIPIAQVLRGSSSGDSRPSVTPPQSNRDQGRSRSNSAAGLGGSPTTTGRRSGSNASTPPPPPLCPPLDLSTALVRDGSRS